jgi:hypothetical protein
MKKLTDKKLKEILKNWSFEIEGKHWRLFKKSDYYRWIKEHKDGELVDGLEWSLEDCVRDCAGQFLQAIRYLNF